MKINTLSNYLKETYGKKLYRLALSSSCSCPNRDGTAGVQGCIFCSNGASDGFAQLYTLSANEQIERAKQLVKNKNKSGGYIAYFQTYTSTYAPIERLEKLFFDAINNEEIFVLSIATRPDCLDKDILDLLKRLNKIKPVWVELGLQSIHEKTAMYINRGYDLECFDNAVKNLKAIGVQVIVHLILGLPFETEEDMINSVRYMGKSGVDGVKLQLLHVMEGTPLCKQYYEGAFETLTMEKYTDILIKCIENLPPNIVIHRMTGDGAKRYLVSPKWSGDKKKTLNYINNQLKIRDVVQGSKAEI